MIDKPTPMTETDMLSAVGHLCMNQKTAEKLVDLSRDEYQAIIVARDAQWIALLKSKSYVSEIKYEFYEAIEATMATQDETILVDIYSEE